MKNWAQITHWALPLLRYTLLLPSGDDHGNVDDDHDGEDDVDVGNEDDVDDNDKGPTMGSELNHPQNGAFFSFTSAS